MAQIDALFNSLIERKGSDLHLEEGQKPKFRQNGRLVVIDEYPVFTQESLAELLSEIAAPEQWDRYLTTGDLDFAYSLGTNARFRANYFRHYYGLGAVFRLIPSVIKSIDELEMPPRMKDFSKWRSGMVLVTGPTGSGKSTSLAALIDHLNANFSKKIVTIEEPVEFIHKNKKSMITHREVGEDTASFADGLRSAIKSDVDIILVGEMRDRETIELALTAAEMGILVFGTLHTNSAAKTIDRVIDVFPAAKKNQIRTILSNTLKAIVAQQLVISADQKRRYAAYEILLKSPGLSAIIQSGETVKLNSEIQLNRGQGMILMDDYLLELVKAGKVAMSEAYMKAQEKSRFATAPKPPTPPPVDPNELNPIS